MDAVDIASIIFIRDQYRHTRLNYAVRVLVCAFLILCMSVVGNIVLMMGKDKYRYIITNHMGHITKLVPMSQPNMSDEDVAKWTVDAVTRINTFDFANYRSQFTYAQSVLTGIGWDSYEKALKDSGNFVAVKENRYVTTAVPNGPAQVINIGPSKGADGSIRYIWKVIFPMLITYRSTIQSTSQDLRITATVVRMPEFINEAGLGIRQIIGDPG